VDDADHSLKTGKVHNSPSPEAIRGRAYEMFLRRSGEPGHDREDWLAADQELKREDAEATRIARN
jgi:hypothetical protein